MVIEGPRRPAQYPRVAIVTVNYNGWRDTLACLESVRHIDYPDYLMIVVDNDSRDESPLRIKEWAREKEDYLLVEYPEVTARAGKRKHQHGAASRRATS